MRILLCLLALIGVSAHALNPGSDFDSDCDGLLLAPGKHKANLWMKCTATFSSTNGENAISGYIDNSAKAQMLSFNYIKRNGDVGTIELKVPKNPVVNYASDPMASEEVRQLLLSKKVQPSDVAGIALNIVAFEPKPKFYKDPDEKFVENPVSGGNSDKHDYCQWVDDPLLITSCGTPICIGKVNCDSGLVVNAGAVGRARDGVCDAAYAYDDEMVHGTIGKISKNNPQNATFAIPASSTTNEAQ